MRFSNLPTSHLVLCVVKKATKNLEMQRFLIPPQIKGEIPPNSSIYILRDRSLPGKVEFGQNSDLIPRLVLVLFGQKCTPIAKILLLMKRSAVSGCACTTQKKTSLPK